MSDGGPHPDLPAPGPASDQAPRSEALQITDLPVVGMTCAACVRRVERALLAVPGVTSASVNLATRSARVEGLGDDAGRAALVQAVRAEGYEVPIIGDATRRAAALEAAEQAETRALDRDVRLALVLAVPVLIVAMTHGLIPMSPALVWGQALLSGAVVLGPGRRFLVGAWHALARKTADMSVLVAIGTLAAWLSSAAAIGVALADGHPVHHAEVYFDAAAAIILFVLVGKRLEARARRGLADAVRGLVGLVPERAARVDDDDLDVPTPVAALVPGDRVRVRPGGRVPADGPIVSGHVSVDEAMLRGESAPIDKAPGDTLRQGTLVVDGAAIMTVTTAGRDTALGRMVDAVERAQGDKAPIARLADRVAAVFVPIVLGLAALTFLVHALALGDVGLALERAVAVL
ncbi:MAG: cation-translocating P-type ATPase, partial [Deltaproteobacteria bacterium]|nr:cation-translocating P-type ATPase [Deltaproteobacteria bacterium]